jgi:hypothetical protein
MMTTHNAALRRLAFSAILLAFPINQAVAQDAAAVAKHLKALSAKQGVELGWSNVTGDASSMVIEGLTVKAAGETNAFPLGNVTLSGVTEVDGGFRVDTTTTAPISSTSEGVTVELSEIVVKGLRIPAEDSDDPLAALSFYESAEMASADFSMGGKSVFSIKGLSSAISPLVEGKPVDFTANIASFTGDLSGVTDPQTKAIVDAFGYQTINGSYQSAGTWNVADGRLNVTQNDITVENAGKFGFKLDLGGYTLDFIKKMQEVQQKMAAQPTGEQANSAAEMEMLGLMQQLSLNGATIRFDDASLTGKILDYVAKQQGQKREDVVNLAKAALPFALMQVQLADLAAAISPAINAYLDDPRSIEIKATPPQPVPFALIGGAAMANPNDPGATAKALWSMLGVTVTANQP